MGDGITSWQPFDRLRAFSKQEKAGVVEQGAWSKRSDVRSQTTDD
jgi:hypothetical protein